MIKKLEKTPENNCTFNKYKNLFRLQFYAPSPTGKSNLSIYLNPAPPRLQTVNLSVTCTSIL